MIWRNQRSMTSHSTCFRFWARSQILAISSTARWSTWFCHRDCQVKYSKMKVTNSHTALVLTKRERMAISSTARKLAKLSSKCGQWLHSIKSQVLEKFLGTNSTSRWAPVSLWPNSKWSISSIVSRLLSQNSAQSDNVWCLTIHQQQTVLSKRRFM